MSEKKTKGPTKGSRRPSARRTRSPVGEVLAAVADAARSARVRWYLFGAQAVAVYGVARMSADVDVTMEVPAGGTKHLVRAMAAKGLRARVADEAFVKATRVLPLVHEASGWPVDLVLAGPGLEVEFLERARLTDVAGVRAPVIAPEDLIAVKILAGRAKDLEDVRGLLVQPGLKLDLRKVRQVLAILEGALDQHDLVPLFERLVAARKG